MATNRDYSILLTVRADLEGAIGQIKSLDSGLGGLKGTALELAGALGVGFSIAGLVDFIKSTIEANQQLGNLSQTLGISTQTLSAIDQQAKKSKLAIEDIQTALVGLSKAATGLNADGAKGLNAIGISAKQAATIIASPNGLATLLDLVSKKFAGYNDGAAKASLATAIFSRSGAELIPLLNALGIQGLGTVTQKAIAAGTAIGQGAVDASQKFGNAMDDLNAKLQGAVNQGLAQFTPEIQHLSELIDDPEFALALKGTADGIVSIATAAANGVADLVKFVGIMQQLVGFKLDGNIGGDVGYQAALTEYTDTQAELARRQSNPLGSGFERSKEAFTATAATLDPVSALFLPNNGDPLEQGSLALKSDADLKARLATLTTNINAYRAESNKATLTSDQLRDQLASSMAPGPHGAKTNAPTIPTTDGKTAVDNTKELAEANLQLQNALLSLQQRAVGPITAAWTQYNKVVLDAQAQADKAIKLGGDPAQESATVAQITATAAQIRDQSIKQDMDQLQIAFLQSTGQTAAAATLQITDQWQRMLDDLKSRSDTAGVAMINKLINVQTAQASFQQLQTQANTALDSMNTDIAAINNQVASGQLYQTNADQRIASLEQQRLPILRQIAQAMQAAALASGDPQLISQAQAFNEKLAEIATSADLAGQHLAQFKADAQDAFQSGLYNFLTTGIAQANNLGEAIRALGKSIIDSLGQAAAKQLSEGVTTKLFSLFDKGKDQNTDLGSSATQLTTAGGAVVAGGAAVSAGAASLLAAATALKAAGIAGGASSASNVFGAGAGGAGGFSDTSSAGGSSGSGWVGLIGTVLSLFGYAGGGPIVGPGGPKDDRVLLRGSPGEYVQSAAAVDHYGLPFMHALNQRALPRFAQGGLIGGPTLDDLASPITARRSPRANLPDNGTMAQQPLAIKNVLVLDQDLIPSSMAGARGEKVVMSHIKANITTLKSWVR